ncbi:uncharacterized protein LOC122049170 [Zingiber officinale]|uniref:DUF868 family protein n=1 Tax=Zingiber officinale TaxID=94328 RepID=A0A8J5HGV9_ZINOF|nr:uncharacterized protein LOC122049170 [Zingiber officinale]KAG6524187.1 hypothetical protein ZIOFF_014078 [Zingiber officinale]
MQEPPFPVPSCFSAGGRVREDPTTPAAKSGHSVVTSVYRTKIAGHCRLINVAWHRDVLSRGLSVSVDDEASGSEASDGHGGNSSCPVVSFKVEIRPWHFWRKHGSKRFQVDGRPVDFVWDLRRAKFSGEPEPQSGFFVAVASEHEVVLLLGDEKEAHQKTGCRPATIDATLVSRWEHVFGRTRFATRARFQQKGGGRQHEIAVEYTGGGRGNADPEMVVKIDGAESIHVKRLQWKFRGNECVTIGRARVDVYWDVHDWLFHPAGAGGLRHAVFIFKPVSFLTSSSSMPLSSSSTSTSTSAGAGAFCLFLHAWKLD